MSRKQAERDLERLARKRVKLHEQRRAASQELAAAVNAARAAGVPPTEIARLAGISRRAVYDFLDRQ